jgi:hypothetical protein
MRQLCLLAAFVAVAQLRLSLSLKSQFTKDYDTEKLAKVSAA